MIEYIVSSMICAEYEKVFRDRWIDRLPLQAMELDFSLHVDHDNEDGYRHLIIRIMNEANYVTVLFKETWNLRPGCKGDYVEGDTGWILASHHDSCWSDDGIRKLVYLYRHEFGTIATPLFNKDGWYVTIDVTEEEIQEKRQLIRDRDNRDFSRHINGDPWKDSLPCVKVVREGADETTG